MRWESDATGAMVPVKDEVVERATEFYGFTDGEAEAFAQVKSAPRSVQKKFVKRIRRMQRAQGMASTLKEKR